MLTRIMPFVRQFGIAVLISSAGSSVAEVIPFPVDTRYEHWQSSYYRSPTYQVATWSFHQVNEPGKVQEFSEDSNFEEYAVRYGNFKSETTWWDSGISWAQTWQFGNLNYSGSANTPPVNLDRQLSSTYFSSGVEISSYSHYSMATLYVGDGNGAGWQPPSDPNVDPTILSESGDPSDIQPLKVTASAKDLASGNAIDKTGTQLNGEYLDATGSKVFKTSAGQKFMAQVSVPGNNNIGISAFGETHPPRILIGEDEWNWGDDISKSTTPVWAGQIIALACVLAPGVMGAPPVESYEWIVDGDSVKDVQLVNTNGFYKIPLTVKTNSTITFAWLGATPSPTVTVKVKIKGLDFSQKASFTVSKPNYEAKDHRNGVIVALPTASAAQAVRLRRVAPPIADGEINGYLATVTTDRALGFVEQEFHFYQKIASSFHEQRNAAGEVVAASYRSFQNRLDLSAPYPIFIDGANFSGATEPNRGVLMVDSPTVPIGPSSARAQALDSFETWVMFKAADYTSTWISVAKNQWFWHWIYEKNANGAGVLSFDSWNVSGFESTSDLPTWEQIHVEP